MSIRGIARTKTVKGNATGTNAPIYVDSDDNKLKMIPAGSGTTEVEVVDASSSQSLTNKTLTSPIVAVNAGVATGAGTNLATAAAITQSGIACLAVTGATDTGFALPVATVGAVYIFKKMTTDTLNLYSASTIAGAAGTTAVPVGVVGHIVFCAVAGDWRSISIAS